MDFGFGVLVVFFGFLVCCLIFFFELFCSFYGLVVKFIGMKKLGWEREVGEKFILGRFVF